ncbi:MAG: zinc-dependent metalloprotease [Coprobacter sp.]|nr:zinc-dependent metalloprotease [Coprobacter sp.]
MKKRNLIFALMVGISLCGFTPETSAKNKKSKKKEAPTAQQDTAAKETKYDKLIKGAKSQKGLFTTHLSRENVLYIEIPDSLMNRTFLISNRMASTSNNSSYVAGQMITQPFMIRFSKNEQNVFLHLVQNSNIVDKNDPIAASFEKNFSDPVLKAFKIEASNGKNTVINMTEFFRGNEKAISPLGNSLLSAPKGTYDGSASYIKEVKSFPQNIEIRTVMNFNSDKGPSTYTVHRSIVLLPEVPMRPRLQDNRVGFFSSSRSIYTSNSDKIEKETFIHRWRLEPKDSTAYFNGELTEPVKPIVFYVDSAFPEKWRDIIRQGIEDWQKAFEAAGFKNAIIAKDYPKDDPDFDPDDMRYSCIKYATTNVANAMGPSYVDPRSGEILTADVIWYHNVISLVHNWRLIQTGAVDPRVRKATFDDDVMRESLRYVTSHEVGHTVGLMHNMGASYAFPIDSLRSPSFTQKYGTTPSIMDYARNNFIAQPGDYERGVRLIPPVLGVYDIYAVNWGYRLIPETNTPQEEKAVLNRWIAEKSDDPMFEFGAQQYPMTFDPTDQTEDLGNDHMKAGELAVNNLKYIMANFEKWYYQQGDDYSDIANVYKEILSQYSRHLRHVYPYLGGVIYKEARQGDGQAAVSYVSKAQQKEAIKWILNQARTCESWLAPSSLLRKIEGNFDTSVGNIIKSVPSALLNSGALYRIQEANWADPKNSYTLNGYMEDVVAELFKYTYQNKPLNATEMSLQSNAIALMIKGSGLTPPAAAKAKALDAENAYEIFMHEAQSATLPCSLEKCARHQDSDDVSFTRILLGSSLNPMYMSPLMTGTLKRVLTLYKQHRASTSDAATRDFYDYQILTIESLFKQ